MKQRKSRVHLMVGAVIAAVVAVGAVAAPAAAVEPRDPDTAMDAWTDAFWVPNSTGGGVAYRWSDKTGNASWLRGSDLSTLVAEYQRTGQAKYLDLIARQYNYITSSSGWGAQSTWCSRIASGSFVFDDAMWTLLPLIRAYQITGTTTYLTAAQTTFDCLYAAGWKPDPGILTYHLGDHFVAANDTFGGIIAAYELFDLTGDAKYKTQAANLLKWSVDDLNMFVPSTGEVYNARNFDATKSWRGGTSQIDYNDWTYNYGVFIAAMGQAYRHTTGTVAATYLSYGLAALERVHTYIPGRPNVPGVVSNANNNNYNMTQANGVLTDETSDYNGTEFKRDFIEYSQQFLNATSGTATVAPVFKKYTAWLQLNANIAWSNRNASNLMSQTSATLKDPRGENLATSGFATPASTGIKLSNAAALAGVQAMVSVPSDGTNVAPRATATASSQYSNTYAASKVVDNTSGQHTIGEWASAGTTTPWIQLTWPTIQRLNKVVLFDRTNTVDNANSGTLEFSDGSSVAVSGLSQTGEGLPITFAPRDVTWVKFTAAGGTGNNVGLSEFQAYAEYDLAAGKPATASSTYPGTAPSYSAANAVDSDLGTRYSNAEGAGWFQVDLGSTQSISTVETDWEAAYAKSYTIQVSTDGTNFTTVATRSAANQNQPFEAGPTVDSFAPTQARYVRIDVTAGRRATNWNFSFWAFKVFG